MGSPAFLGLLTRALGEGSELPGRVHAACCAAGLLAPGATPAQKEHARSVLFCVKRPLINEGLLKGRISAEAFVQQVCADQLTELGEALQVYPDAAAPLDTGEWDLPQPVAHAIVGMLTPREVARLAATSRLNAAFCRTALLWKALTVRDFVGPGSPPLPRHLLALVGAASGGGSGAETSCSESGDEDDCGAAASAASSGGSAVHGGSALPGSSSNSSGGAGTSTGDGEGTRLTGKRSRESEGPDKRDDGDESCAAPAARRPRAAGDSVEASDNSSGSAAITVSTEYRVTLLPPASLLAAGASPSDAAVADAHAAAAAPASGLQELVALGVLPSSPSAYAISDNSNYRHDDGDSSGVGFAAPAAASRGRRGAVKHAIPPPAAHGPALAAATPRGRGEHWRAYYARLAHAVVAHIRTWAVAGASCSRCGHPTSCLPRFVTHTMWLSKFMDCRACGMSELVDRTQLMRPSLGED